MNILAQGLQLNSFQLEIDSRISKRMYKSKERFRVAFSHDVDRVYKSFQGITHLLRHLRNGDTARAIYQITAIVRHERYWCFEQICKIEDAYGIKSTYYFLNESYPFRLMKLKSWRLSLGYYDIFSKDVSDMIRKLDDEGHEIGLHGSYRSYKNYSLLEKEKCDLEKILGKKIKGIRQHYLNLNADTWQIQRSLGFLYDASYGYRDRVGFKDDVFVPFPLDDKRDYFIVPMAIMDCCLMKTADPWKRAVEIIKIAEQNAALLVLNWHQQIFDEREYPGYQRMYIRIIEESMRRNAEFVTLGSYIDVVKKQNMKADIIR
jgi:peptidoglycan/xylan/chitin deacetylase (PgdA/CDA1 family)